MNLEFVLGVLEVMSGDNTTDLWWRTKDEYAPITFFVNCNDIFMWGCSDAETITPENLLVLKQSYADSEDHGAELFCARVRQMRPQGAWYSYCPREEWHLFDACGPERETGFGNPSKPGAYPRGSYSDKALAEKAIKP